VVISRSRLLKMKTVFKIAVEEAITVIRECKDLPKGRAAVIKGTH